MSTCGWKSSPASTRRRCGHWYRPSAAMFLLNGVQIYLARTPVDLRKSIDGLSLLVSHGLGQDPFSAQLFVFTNRRRDKLKALHYDVNGFVLYYKRLERGRFRWPVIPAE